MDPAGEVHHCRRSKRAEVKRRLARFSVLEAITARFLRPTATLSPTRARDLIRHGQYDAYARKPSTVSEKELIQPSIILS